MQKCVPDGGTSQLAVQAQAQAFFYIRNMINNGVYSCEKLKYVLKVFMKKHCQNCKILPNYSVCLILRTISISFCWTLRTNSICSCQTLRRSCTCFCWTLDSNKNICYQFLESIKNRCFQFLESKKQHNLRKISYF